MHTEEGGEALMIQVLMLSSSLIAITFIGCNVLYLFSGRSMRKLSIPEALAVSYGLGIGLVSLEMLLFYMLGIGYSVRSVLSPWIILIAVNLFRYARERKGCAGEGRPSPGPGKFGVLDTFLAGGIAFEVAYAFFRALIKPIEAYDAIAIYAIRSKIFYLAGSVPADYFASLAKLFPHADYPLNIQLIEAFLYTSMGSLNEALVKAIFPLFFAAILCVLYFAIRRFASRTYALIFTFILAGVPHFNNYATNAYLEVPLAFYVLVAGLYLLRWIAEEGHFGYLALSAAFAGLAGWTKNEGLLYCVIYTAILSAVTVSRWKRIRAKDIFSLAAYSGIILLIVLPWAAVKAKWHIANDEIMLANINPFNLAKQVPKLGTIGYELQKQLFGPKKWNILWPAFIAAVLVYFRKAVRMPARFVLAVILMALGGYVLFYMISYVDVAFFASKTWARFMLDFLPLAVYLLALLLKDDAGC
jgi:hypothetical protein